MPYDLSVELDVNDQDLLILGQEVSEDDNSQEEILRRLIERQASDLDPRPSSPNYILSVPASFEFEADYQNVERFKTNAYITTADREGLILRGLDFGMAPYPATYAVLKGRFNIPLPLGTAFSLGDLNYSITEEAGSDEDYFYYYLTCDTPGVIGNTQLGRLIPTQYVPGLNVETAELTEVTVPGEEEEDTEAFRARLLSRYQYKRFCGNRADYIAEACAFPGVGRVKVDSYRSEEDGKVYIDLYFTDADGNVPSEELVGQLQEYFNPLEGKDRSEQTVEETGNGQAPIDHFVQAKPVQSFGVWFQTEVKYREGADKQEVNRQIRVKVEEYLKDVANTWGDTEMTEAAKFPRRNHLQLSYNRAGAKILEIDGVLDYLSIGFDKVDLPWNTIPALDHLTIMDWEDFQ